jgi:hypothetical protein
LYTLSIVMAAGFYTVCYDLGAQAERLRAWGWGELLPLGLEPHAVNDALYSAAQRLATLPESPPPLPAFTYPDPLVSYYGFTPDDLERMGLQPSTRALHAGDPPFAWALSSG